MDKMKWFNLRSYWLSILSVMLFILVGCSGGGSSNLASEPVANGQALLGPLINATVEVFPYDDLETSIYSTTTSDSTELSEAGLFDIPGDLLSDNTLYLITITGGQDIDANDNGIVDASFTNNKGTLHLLAIGSSLKDGFIANILTDIVYHKVAYLLLAKYSQDTIMEEMDLYAGTLLKEDVDGDGDKDQDDLLVWDPVLDKVNTTRVWSFFEGCIAAIHNDASYSSELSMIMRGLVGSVDTPGLAWEVALSGNYAYVADDSSGLQVIDISDPANPVIVGAVATPDDALGIALSGNYAYVADWSSGLQVIDISDPTNPVIVGAGGTLGGKSEVALSGNYAYVAGYSRLDVVDISNPTSPVNVGYMYLGDFTRVALSGNYAYVTSLTIYADYRFLVIDISDPASLVIVGTVYMSPSEIFSVALSGNYAYLGSTDYSSGLQVIDISDHTSPVIVGAVVTPGNTYGEVALSGDYAYVAGECGGLQVMDISDPPNPMIVGIVSTPGVAKGVAISGNYAYVADGAAGLVILRAIPD